MNLRALTLSVCAVIAVAGCGGGNDNASNSSTSTSQPSTTSTTTTPSASKGSKPKVRVPKGSPPKKLVVKDLKKGKGPAAKSGDQVTVQYVGVDYKTGKQFDASWDRGQPLPFQLGAGQVIPGWDRGVAGMRVGGRRELIIPPALAYGPQGQPPAIGPNATLVFVVDLLGVQ
jgi:peptidylprolyl isomerase